MIDDHDRPDQSQATPANDENALDRDDIQQAQDQAGIAGEPQPTDTAGDAEPKEPTLPPV